MDVVTLIQGNEESSLTPFFMVHAISGIALPFLRLDSLGDNDRPVYGITNHIHCPDHHDHEDFEYPSSLAELAKLYLREIRHVQPRGPYLLGGWSMGGMIAMFMAQALESRGEEVLKVVMIDSANPESFPCFGNTDEHKAYAKATYTRISRQFNASADAIFVDDDDNDDDDEVPTNPNRRESTDSLYSAWDTSEPDDEAPSTRASSVFDFYTPGTRPGTPVSLPCSSEETSACCSDDDDDDDDNDDNGNAMEIDSIWGIEEDDLCEEPDLDDLLFNINLHVYQGMGLIAGVSPGDLFRPGTKSDFDVVLVKCRPEPFDASRGTYDPEGAHYVWNIMRDKNMRWDASRFRSFESVPFSGDHDGAFEPRHVGELSTILRAAVEKLE